MASNDRAEALARLAALGATPDLTATGDAPVVERTGEEVYVGGEEARLLVSAAHLSYATKDGRQYVDATPGDVVLLSAAEAKRLDALGVTMSADASDDEVEEQTADDGILTDEQLAAAKAEELVAYVGQHPDERDRVRAAEEARPADKQRKTVLEATAPAE